MKRWCVAALVPISLVLGGCAAFSNEAPDGGSGLQVTAAFYPLQYVTQRVAGDHATVTNLTAPGGEPHDLELTVQEVAQVAESDLTVYERGFQPAVDDAVDENAGGAVLDAGDVVHLVPFKDHGVDSDEDDPHFWQDPLLLAKLGDAVADELAKVDPDNAADYRANAAALHAQLVKLDQAYAQGLQGCQRTTIVVSHDAFGYLERYGLTMETILGLSPDSEPTPADLARLQDLIEKDGITTVFGEALVSPKTAESLAHDSGVQAKILDPIEGLSDATAGQDYFSLMRSNLAALEEANGC